MPVSRLINRNVVGENGRTSMRLEPELWDALREICRREQSDIGATVRRIEAWSRGYRNTGMALDGEARTSGGRTSAVRVFIVEYFRTLADGREGGRGCPGYSVASAVPKSVLPDQFSQSSPDVIATSSERVRAGAVPV